MLTVQLVHVRISRLTIQVTSIFAMHAQEIRKITKLTLPEPYFTRLKFIVKSCFVHKKNQEYPGNNSQDKTSPDKANTKSNPTCSFHALPKCQELSFSQPSVS